MASLALVRPSAVEADGDHSVRPTAIFTDSQREELREIVRTRSFKTGKFTLSSGDESNLYFNMKPTMMDVRGSELAARALISLMESTGAEFVSGLEMGAVPVIGAMAAVGSTAATAATSARAPTYS